jgi:hypothetical protein
MISFSAERSMSARSIRLSRHNARTASSPLEPKVLVIITDPKFIPGPKVALVLRIRS